MDARLKEYDLEARGLILRAKEIKKSVQGSPDKGDLAQDEEESGDHQNSRKSRDIEAEDE